MDEFLKEVKEMTEDDILLALEEQADLYSDEEIKILRQELNKRGIKSAPEFSIKGKEEMERVSAHKSKADYWTEDEPIKETNAYKIFGIIVIVVGIIAGIIMGNVLKMAVPQGSYYVTYTYEFNYYLMVASWIASIVFGTLFLALGEIVAQLNLTNQILMIKIMKKK